jgi:hypothetical protein
LLTLRVRGCNRVPEPPARMMPFMEIGLGEKQR